MDSRQREEAIDPSATMNDLECSSSVPSPNTSSSDSTPTNSIEPNEAPIDKKREKSSWHAPLSSLGVKSFRKVFAGGDNFVGERSRNFELKIKIA